MVELKPTTVGDVQIRLAQGHGALKAGGESHLVIKLPYTDRGATTVRAWIGSEDRTQSYVGKGDYNNHADVYDIHAMAPSSLDGNTRWWVEIVKPDGYKAIGSATPLFK
ncbi:MAG: hypothetical protein O3A51_01370 [Verrucomicrobia bacterium]|nr:hypothetical protein [Verrucomicrobiota bacterium]